MGLTLLEKIQQIGIVPVIKLEDAKDAAPLAKALCEGGLPCAEVTFRTNAAVQAIKNMKNECPEMLVGAGTVLTIDQVDEAIDAGAEFIVSPGLNPDIVKYCTENDIVILPGCTNPSDVEQAIKYGLSVVKFFPAEAAGGIKTIKAMSAPYHQMKFMPTGGIDPSNVNEYLNFDKILACGGTWMVPTDLIQAGKFDEICKLVEEAVYTMQGFQLAHIGINCDNVDDAHQVADAFNELFGFQPNENPSSIFSATFVETMKTPFLGAKGHIAIAANSVERAKAYLERKGVDFNESSAVFRKDGKMQAVYMADEIGGFAVHLVRNPKLA
ncbi:bifunctional 4-hydroxy-2-oxoglutarate aldolase/2-dehydro-3-deoxy-phosphogluconate aldolase [Anaerostipes faecalis]|uniref:bifunctional 4-hydroxy-2-oxoglutarate aldolase/2-dehydro-3-deoxy-phosphogluconate aldolase n=1 Tax=Anaerostipes faecalis TaxID=2738446 RepID=UPI003F0E0B17